MANTRNRRGARTEEPAQLALGAYCRGFEPKRLAAIADCTVETAKRYQAGQWPSHRALMRIVANGGQELMARVFGPLFARGDESLELIDISARCLEAVRGGRSALPPLFGIPPAYIDSEHRLPYRVAEIRRLNAVEALVMAADGLEQHSYFGDLVGAYRSLTDEEGPPYWDDARDRLDWPRGGPLHFLVRRDHRYGFTILSATGDDLAAIDDLTERPLTRFPDSDLARDLGQDLEAAIVEKAPRLSQLRFVGTETEAATGAPTPPWRRRHDRLVLPFRDRANGTARLALATCQLGIEGNGGGAS